MASSVSLCKFVEFPPHNKPGSSPSASTLLSGSREHLRAYVVHIVRATTYDVNANLCTTCACEGCEEIVKDRITVLHEGALKIAYHL